MFALAKSYKINEGIHKIKLYPPTSKLPPLDEKALKKLKEIKNTKLEFKIELGLYNSDNLEGFLGDEEPSKKEETKKPEKEAKPKVEAKPKESTK